MIKLNVYLNFPGNAEEAFRFYKSVFGGDFTSVTRYKDMPMSAVELSTSDENKILNLNYTINQETQIMGSDVIESRGRRMVIGNNVRLAVAPESKADADRIFNALSAEGRIEIPMSDQPWNAYYGSFKDKFGVDWMINYQYKPGEMKTETVSARMTGL